MVSYAGCRGADSTIRHWSIARYVTLRHLTVLCQPDKQFKFCAYTVLGIYVSLFLCCVFIVGLYVVELLRMNESSGLSALLCKTKALFFASFFPSFLLTYFLCIFFSVYKMSAVHAVRP